MLALKRNLKVNTPVLRKNLKHSMLHGLHRGVDEALDFSLEALVSKDGVVLLGYQVRSLEAHKRFWEMCDEVWISRRSLMTTCILNMHTRRLMFFSCGRRRSSDFGLDYADPKGKGNFFGKIFFAAGLTALCIIYLLGSDCAFRFGSGYSGDKRLFFYEFKPLEALNPISLKESWASRAYFSSNGSIAIEIALKMAFLKFSVDHVDLKDQNIDEDDDNDSSNMAVRLKAEVRRQKEKEAAEALRREQEEDHEEAKLKKEALKAAQEAVFKQRRLTSAFDTNCLRLCQR
ncbi:hypothetical protein Ahy_Scaffold7g108298 [Arachis hypogaea]|uniref:Uncharacterized protein n=1 Tax=Arachis hypogaea TaxID=3818 RepID=A0A444WPH3_ARAHY|nr:hypothetical protein Ahy_Scaffold7g108298 [Arachis hypogaea]